MLIPHHFVFWVPFKDFSTAGEPSTSNPCKIRSRGTEVDTQTLRPRLPWCKHRDKPYGLWLLVWCRFVLGTWFSSYDSFFCSLLYSKGVGWSTPSTSRPNPHSKCIRGHEFEVFLRFLLSLARSPSMSQIKICRPPPESLSKSTGTVR